jgi:hypothetical protein
MEVGVKPPCITVKVENQMNQISMPSFFSLCRKTINDNYSSTSGLPLILAALPEHQNLFHKVSNLSLLPNGICKSKVYRARWISEKCLGSYGAYYNNTIKFVMTTTKQNHMVWSDNLSEVATAAVTGKVDTLLIEAEPKFWHDNKWRR